MKICDNYGTRSSANNNTHTYKHQFYLSFVSEQKDGGTQLKLIITFQDEGQALFKPMRYM